MCENQMEPCDIYFVTHNFASTTDLHENSNRMLKSSLAVILKDWKSNYMTLNVSTEDPNIYTFHCHVKVIRWVHSVNFKFVKASVCALNVKVRFLAVASFLTSLFLYHTAKVLLVLLSTHANFTGNLQKVGNWIYQAN